MENKAYYTDETKYGNLCLTDRPLYVNCAGVCSFEVDFSGGFENGREDFYLMYLCRGELNITVGRDSTCVLKSGQLIIFSPKTPCIYTNTPGTHVDYFWLHFTGSEAESLLKNTRLPQNCVIDISVDERILSAFQQLFNEYVYRDFLFHTAIVSKLITVCTMFGRAAASLSKENKGTITLSKSLRYINEHYSESITSQDLADLEHLSCGHFRTLFKARTGMTPSYYITTLRLRNACAHLKQTDLSIKEISQSVGFSDQMYFSRVFTKHFGIPPTAFRH
ncbi:MAG: AraC family transcriptional regulator [Eubacteriales bacterium]